LAPCALARVKQVESAGSRRVSVFDIIAMLHVGPPMNVFDFGVPEEGIAFKN
jgi:hypothetical protein